MTNIHFLKVKSNQEKLNKICQTIQDHFLKKERVLIAAPNEQAAQYIDLLLWRMPAESFLPHQIINQPAEVPVAITTEKTNLNSAKVLFNLLPAIHPLVSQFELVYEIYDQMEASKEKGSKERFEAYHSRGFPVEKL